MKISSGDLLITDATIIVGLLVLLTFSSVASPFGQEERSAFFADWYELQRTINAGDRALFECNVLLTNDAKMVESYDSAWSVGMNEIGEEYDTRGPIEDPRLTEYRKGIAWNCDTLAVDKFKLDKQLEELTSWGLEFNYLEENEESKIVESKYHKDLASGPYSVNMINLVMIIPFLLSAIVDTIISSRNEKNESASNIGLGLMILGFVTMIVGLGLIGISFYEAAAPFL